MTDDLRKLKWQCRRGMKELDQLLTRYLDTAYGSASDDEKAGFRALLELSDPELNGYFLGRQVPDDEIIAKAVQRILELT